VVTVPRTRLHKGAIVLLMIVYTSTSTGITALLSAGGTKYGCPCAAEAQQSGRCCCQRNRADAASAADVSRGGCCGRGATTTSAKVAQPSCCADSGPSGTAEAASAVADLADSVLTSAPPATCCGAGGKQEENPPAPPASNSSGERHWEAQCGCGADFPGLLIVSDPRELPGAWQGLPVPAVSASVRTPGNVYCSREEAPELRPPESPSV
jgi:hypothetical protein